MADPAQRLLDPDVARGLLTGKLTPLPAERVSVGPGLAGRVLAAPVVAANPLPPFPSSAMDGYALRAAEAPGPLPVVVRIAAGDDPPPLAPGTACAIATGGVVPEGADCVVPVEIAEEADGRVRVLEDVTAGDHVRPTGSDVAPGTEVMPAGVRVTPLGLAAIAGLGLAAVEVTRRPRVVVLTTGDELRPPGAPLRRGQIHESNSAFVAARAAALGCEVVAVEHVADDPDATEAALARALEAADLVLTTGGVSVGPLDHVRPALDRLGVEQLFWRLALQPGRPTWAGLRGGSAVIGLPGNPLSVLAAMELVVRPAVAFLQGCDDGAPRGRAPLAAPISRLAQRIRALPARLVDGQVQPLGAELSHMLGRAATADVLVLIPMGAGSAGAGELVETVPLG